MRSWTKGVFVFTLLFPFSARAFTSSADSYGFKPALGPTPFFSISSTRTLEKNNFFVSLVLDYAHDSFLAGNQLGTTTDVVNRLLTFYTGVSYGVLDTVTLSAGAPFSPYVSFTQIGSADTSSKMGIGDVRVAALWNFLPSEALSLAVEPFVEIPTGYETLYLSQGAVTGGGNLIAEVDEGMAALSLNAGFHWNPEMDLGDVHSGSAFNAGLGAAFHAGKNWEIFGEGLARTGLQHFLKNKSSIYETNAGVHLKLGSSLVFSGGGGAGFGGGIGASLFHIFTGLTCQARLVAKPKPPPPLPPPPPKPVIETPPLTPPPSPREAPAPPRERKFLPIT